MGLYLLLGLLIYCLACFRQGVWTRHPPQQVAHGQGPGAQQGPLVPSIAAPAHPTLGVGPGKQPEAAGPPHQLVPAEREKVGYDFSSSGS